MTASSRTMIGLAASATAMAILLGGAASPPKAAAPGRLCVLRSSLAGPTVRDDGLVYFRGQPDRRRSYIAAFKGGACARLNPMAIVSLESDGGRICEGDKVRALINASQIPGPACVIDRLLPFSGDLDDPLPKDGHP